MSMTEKGFIRKAQGKVSALAFIAEHREWLTSGSLASLTTPILSKLDNGEIFPTPALKDLTKAVMDHLIAKTISEGQAKLNAPASTSNSGSRAAAIKNYAIEIFDEKDQLMLENGQDDEIKAEHWADRKLDQGGPGWYALLTSNMVMNGKEDIYERRIDRDESLARIYKTRQGSAQATKKMGSSGGKWKMKAKGDHFHFSRG